MRIKKNEKFKSFKIRAECVQKDSGKIWKNPLKFNFFAESLITPELWLQNCHSRSPTPTLDQNNQAKSPFSIAFMSNDLSEKSSIDDQPPETASSSHANIANLKNLLQGSSTHKPLINVLPSSKLLSRNLLYHKNMRKRRIASRSTQNSNLKLNPQVRMKKIKDSNFSPEIYEKNHTHTRNSGENQNQSHQSFPSQFMPRPPNNLFHKFQMPIPQDRFPVLDQNRPHQENINFNLQAPSTVLPPPIVIVPYRK